MTGKANALQVPVAPRQGGDLLWRPLIPTGASTPSVSGFFPRGAALTAPMFLKQRLRIAIDPALDLFDCDIPEPSIDLVHAVIAVSHWHTFSFSSDGIGRMRAYYADPGTPRRIAEEIDLLSLLALECGGSRLSPLLLAGFARVRYGIPFAGAIGVYPLSPEPWPLANLLPRSPRKTALPLAERCVPGQ